MKKPSGAGMGALCVFLSAVVFSTSGLLSKSLPWGALSAVGFRAVFAALLLGFARKSFRITNNLATWLGAAGVAGTSVLFLLANKLTTAANAIVLQYAMPAIVIVLCVVVYRQKLSRRDALTAAVVLLGVGLCFSEGLGGGALAGDLLALGSALTYALVFFAARMPGADPRAYTYQGNLLSLPLLLCIPFDASFSPEPAFLLMGAAMGVAVGLGYLFLSKGMRRGISPVAAAIISNVEPVLNPTWVYLALGEQPGVLSLLGALIVLGAVTLYGARGRKDSPE